MVFGFKETASNQVALPKDDAETVRELLRHLYTPGGCDMDSKSAKIHPSLFRFYARCPLFMFYLILIFHPSLLLWRLNDLATSVLWPQDVDKPIIWPK